ncbi:MAG: bifunctional phosphoglucose/phosphomannose isomerase [Patescibacteria group bacterium]
MKSKIDKSDLRRVILSTPGQFAEGFEIAKNVKAKKDFKRMVVSGMGGSALPVDVLKGYLNDLFLENKDINIVDVQGNRTYKLPAESYDNCLNVICSHSGNTEETIASFEEAIDNKLECIGVSAGGKVEEICKEKGITHIKLPVPFENFQPRMATGHFVSVLLSILMNSGKIPNNSKELVGCVTDYLKSNVKTNENKGKELAKKLVGKTPLIYSSDKFKSLAMIWKIKINENAKVPAFWNYFPELNHNEFVGFTSPKADFHCIMLRDEDDYERNLMRYDATAEALAEKGIETDTVLIEGDTILEKLCSTIAMCDWVSYYLALEYDIDPTPVDMVEDFKKALN